MWPNVPELSHLHRDVPGGYSTSVQLYTPSVRGRHLTTPLSVGDSHGYVGPERLSRQHP